MASPTQASNPVRPLVAYLEAAQGSGELTWDQRVKVLDVTQGSNARLSDATLEVQSDELTPEPEVPVTPPDAENWLVFREISEADAERLYGPTVRCAIGEMPKEDEPRAIVGHGYLVKRNLSFGAQAEKPYWRNTYQLESVLARLSDRATAFVQGRHLMSQALSDALDEAPQTGSDVIHASGLPEGTDWTLANLAKRVPALRCCFNANGKPNRSARPIQVNAGPLDGQPIHVFTGDNDPAAEYWTYYQALRYLCAFHFPWGKAGIEVTMPDVFIGPLDDDPNHWRELWKLEESDIDTEADAVRVGFKEMMVRNCRSFTPDGRRWLEALLLLASESGLRFHEEHATESEGETISVTTAVRFWCPGDKEAMALALEREASHYDDEARTVPRPIADITEHNTINQGRLQLDYGDTATDVLVIGDRKFVTITTELYPLWPIDEYWDGEHGEVDAGLIGEYSSEIDVEGSLIHGCHNTKGAEFALHAKVGRLWGIDTAGEYTAEAYRRTVGAWKDRHKTAWSFAEVPGNTKLPIKRWYKLAPQVRRRRWMKPVAETDLLNRSKGVIIEIGIASDDPYTETVWTVIDDKPTILGDQCAVYFKAQSVTSIEPELFSAANLGHFYEAYLKGKLRLRATFDIDLDERVTGEAHTDDSPLADQAVRHTAIRHRDFRFTDTARFQHTLLPEFETVPPDDTAYAGDVNDGDSAKRAAEQALSQVAGAALRGDPIIPWLEFGEPAIGTPISGIRRTASDDVDIPFGGDVNRVPPVVIAKIYRQTEPDLSTQLMLHDFGLTPHEAPPGQSAPAL